MLHWDRPHFYESGRLFIPKVCEGDPTSSEFNSVMVRLEGGLRSSLDWSHARQKAQSALELGLKLLWEIDLGLNGRLEYPLSNAMQHQALCLALEHFRDTLWQEFRKETLGLVLYRGTANFASHFPWDEQQRLHFNQSGLHSEELYCGRVYVDYLKMLALRLPDPLPLFILLDCRDLKNPFLLSQLTSRAWYDPFLLALKGSPLMHQEFVWEEGHICKEEQTPQTALLLPSTEGHYPGLEGTMKELLQGLIPFRVIPELHLAMEWDGLDQLFYSEESLTAQGKRLIQGFIAAGGAIKNIDN